MAKSPMEKVRDELPMQNTEAYRLDEHNHDEKPLLDQLAGLKWGGMYLMGMK